MDPAMGRILTWILLGALWRHAATENDRDFKMCGRWCHSHERLALVYSLTPGCDSITISANGSSLSVRGRITAQCWNDSSLALTSQPGCMPFCVFWDPLLDLLMVQVNGENITLCTAHGLQSTCCTDLSAAGQNRSACHGIENGTVHGDLLNSQTMAQYEFRGHTVNCGQEFCGKAVLESRGANRIEDAVRRSGVTGRVELPCAHSTVVEMKQDFSGYNVTLPAMGGVLPHMTPSVHLPASLKPAQRKTARVVCTYYRNSTLFQMSSKSILEDVVGISVENEIIRNLPEPVRIMFRHPAVLETQSTKCVSWDTIKDEELEWREQGCVTLHHNTQETECCCDHLTYFAVLVQVNPRTLRHLEALTFITAVGCALSAVSCVVLFVSLCKQRRTENDQSGLVHRGLVVALFLLCLLFVLTGTVANVAHEHVCRCMGALLHYVLLSSLCWMAVEVVHTFRMVLMVFSQPPKPWIWYLVGFGFPVLPVVILASMGNIYGQRMITQSDDITSPYHMCWMRDSGAALLAHYITNVGLLAALVLLGVVMLIVVVKQIQRWPEWRKRRVAFLSLWGLSCLFGTTWGLTFFDFGPLSEIVLFLFCIINSLQGFFLMLRFFMLERMQRGKLSHDGSSTSSTQQHMLHAPEQS